jgi:hypothetical protein
VKPIADPEKVFSFLSDWESDDDYHINPTESEVIQLLVNRAGPEHRDDEPFKSLIRETCDEVNAAALRPRHRKRRP